MAKKEVKVYTFDPIIYPRKLWIAITKENEIKGFSGLKPMDESMVGCVNHAHDDKNNLGGLFIRFEDKDSMTMNAIAHESLHVALEIFRYVDIKVDIDNQETLCYLVGWIAECCEKVKNNKVK